MRNRLFGSVILVSSLAALVLAAGCSTSDDTNDNGSDAGGGGGSDASTSSTSDGGTSTSTGDGSTPVTTSDSGTGGGSDGSTKTDSGGGGTKGIAAPTSTCAPAKVTLNPAVETLLSDKSQSTSNLAAGDFNNDGAQDIAVLLGGETGLAVFFSKKDGTFSAPLEILDTVGNGPGFTVGDFSGDGIPDIVVSSFGVDGTVDNSVDLIVSNGDGTFKPPVNFVDLSDNIFSMVAADFNKDGKLDLLYNGQNGQGILLNNGSGFASPGTMVVVPVDQGLFDAADFNGDKAADVVYADSVKGACIQLNNGSGTLAAGVCYAAVPDQSPDYALAGDLNNDGKMDAVTFYDGHGGTTGRPNVAVYLGKGDGTLGTAVGATVSGTIDGAFLADVNNDGKVDILTFDGTTVSVLINDGTGAFTAMPATYGLSSGSGSSEFPVIAGDFRGNGLRGFAALDDTSPAEGIAVVSATCSN